MILKESPGSKKASFPSSSLEHVLAELRLMALRLHARAEILRGNGSSDDTERFKGLYIAEKEIDDILEFPVSRLFEGGAQYTGSSPGSVEPVIERAELEVSTSKQEAIARGIELRLEALQKLFSLSRFEIQTILLCLLLETDLRYQKLIAYLQDDVTRKAPTVNLVLNLLCNSQGEALNNRKVFADASPLLKNHLIYLQDDRNSGSTSLLAKFVHLDSKISGYLLDQDGPDSRVAPAVSLIHPQKTWSDLMVNHGLKNRLQALVARYRDTALVGNLQGAAGAFKRDMAEAIAHDLNRPLLVVDLSTLTSAEPSTNSLISLVFREALLDQALIYLEKFEHVSQENAQNSQIVSELAREIAVFNGWILIATEKEVPLEKIITGKINIAIKLPLTSFAERQQIWQKLVQDDPEFKADIDLADIAGKFHFDHSQISEAASLAKNLARWRDPAAGIVNDQDLFSACRKRSSLMLSSLARKIQPVYHWEDIILPQDQLEQLHEICNYVEHFHNVYDSWGFARKVSLGRGLKALFAGPSGTGKTMAAEVVANHLKIDLYKIDLSTVVSKYIGETEKNLERIFAEGQTLNAILFFDEADALFGKRSEVRDAHDRYANIETAYLLQKMDEYEGTVILATNLRKNMDEAFARRLHYTLEFPLPEEKDRLRIWKQIFPAESPLDKSVDLPFLARQFKISGGNIKNIAVNAAFLAAAEGGTINMECLIKATRREYQKIGKLCTEVEFGSYFEWIKK